MLWQVAAVAGGGSVRLRQVETVAGIAGSAVAGRDWQVVACGRNWQVVAGCGRYIVAGV